MNTVIVVLSVLGALGGTLAQDEAPLHRRKGSFTCLILPALPTLTTAEKKRRNKLSTPPLPLLPYCPVNEHYEKHSTKCQITCENKECEDVTPCPPTSACFCNSGYVRNSDGVCIKKNKCPPPCGPNERYINNTKKCQITCRNLPCEPDIGPCYPSSGCFCIIGYVRNEYGVCIKREDCPPRCGPNERYINNTKKCQITCRNKDLEPHIGPCKPSSGCFCNIGYVRNDYGVCIKKEDCPPPKCKKGEVYTTCGSSCPTTCESRGDTCKVCTAQCVEGCFCAGNTIRGPNGTCIDPKKCPPRVCPGKNQIFDHCPPTCPPTEDCSNIWSRFDCSHPIDCCKPQCRCKPGYYRNRQNVCISAQECINCGGKGKATAVASATAEAGDADAEATAEAGDADAEATAEAGDTGAEATA